MFPIDLTVWTSNERIVTVELHHKHDGYWKIKSKRRSSYRLAKSHLGYVRLHNTVR